MHDSANSRRNGRALANEILAETRQAVAHLGRTPVVRVVAIEPDAASRSYLRIKGRSAEKAGMKLELREVGDRAGVIAAVTDPTPDAVLVQLPLPARLISAQTDILNALPQEKDADVLSLAAYERFLAGDPEQLLPPVVGAVKKILGHIEVDPKEKRVVVIGEGRLVGQPVAAWLEGEGAKVTTLTKETFTTPESRAALKQADMVVSGAGVPMLVTPELISPGVVLLDAGTSELNGALAGDVDPACAEVAAYLTPVPGGLGPVVVACLFENVARLAR